MNLSRLKNCMRRAEQGEPLTLGFFGGSITQGSLASAPSLCYAARVFQWWKNTFPAARFEYVNSGIGGTDSHFGTARIVSDLLMYQPDFVVVDFSVNDLENAFCQETYEGVIRQLLQWPSEPAVLLLNNVFYDSGKSVQKQHNAVGDWYGVPHISVRDTIYRKIQAGEYARGQLTPDGLHPNDLGHGLIAAEITAFLERVRVGLHEPEASFMFPQPLTANAYEHAKRLTIHEICPVLSGFRADAAEKMGHLDFFKNGWIGGKPGDSIRFETEASCIAVQYRKRVQRPALSAWLVLDGRQENAVRLEGDFDEDWGDCLYLQPILHHGERKRHTIEITVAETENAAAIPFYLLALIIA